MVFRIYSMLKNNQQCKTKINCSSLRIPSAGATATFLIGHIEVLGSMQSQQLRLTQSRDKMFVIFLNNKAITTSVLLLVRVKTVEFWSGTLGRVYVDVLWLEL